MNSSAHGRDGGRDGIKVREVATSSAEFSAFFNESTLDAMEGSLEAIPSCDTATAIRLYTLGSFESMRDLHATTVDSNTLGMMPFAMSVRLVDAHVPASRAVLVAFLDALNAQKKRNAMTACAHELGMQIADASIQPPVKPWAQAAGVQTWICYIFRKGDDAPACDEARAASVVEACSQRVCAACGDVALQQCGAECGTQYCSSACQAAAWPWHKKAPVCLARRRAQAAARADEKKAATRATRATRAQRLSEP